MSNSSFASLNAQMLARKGEARPSQEPRFGSMPWHPPRPQTIAAIPPLPPLPAASADQKVRLDQVATIWPAPKPTRSAEESAWIPNKPAPALDGSHLPVKTTLRLTHAQARAVRLAALVLDKPQQEILANGLMAQLEALACADLSSCSCFKAVLAGLQASKPAEANLPAKAAESSGRGAIV